MVCRLFCCRHGNKGRYCTDSALYCQAALRYNGKHKEAMPLTVRERILALKLLEKQEKRPEYTKKIGVAVCIVKCSTKKMEEKYV